MTPATWTDCKADFSYDGGLVDLIAPGTGQADWESFWAALRSGTFELHAFRDNVPMSLLPNTAAWCLHERQVASVSVSVRTGTVRADCHFFGGDLELTLDPREVVNEQAFDSVLVLMRFVAAAIRLPVLAVPENGGSGSAFLRVLPDGQASFLPPEERKTS